MQLPIYSIHSLADHLLAPASTSYSCRRGIIVIFLLGMLFMFSRVYRNRICTAALMSRMSDASRYSLAHSRSAWAEIMLLSTYLLVLETILRF